MSNKSTLLCLLHHYLMYIYMVQITAIVISRNIYMVQITAIVISRKQKLCAIIINKYFLSLCLFLSHCLFLLYISISASSFATPCPSPYPSSSPFIPLPHPYHIPLPHQLPLPPPHHLPLPHHLRFNSRTEMYLTDGSLASRGVFGPSVWVQFTLEPLDIIM